MRKQVRRNGEGCQDLGWLDSNVAKHKKTLQ